MMHRRRTKVQLRLILTQIKLLIDNLLQLLIKLLNLLMRRAVHNNSKLHAVQTEKLRLLVQQLQHLLRKIMQHEVAGLIAIAVVDNVELADADDKNIHRLMLLLLFGNILKKFERIAKICYRVNRINRAMVSNRAHENIRLVALALEHITVAAAHYIIALRITRPVLHSMIGLFAAHDGADIAYIAFSVIWMQMLHPDTACVEHIFPRQVELLHGIRRPARHIRAHIADINITIAHSPAERLKNAAFQTIMCIKNAF